MLNVDGDVGFWKQIAQWLWAPLGVLLAMVWASLTGRLNKVEDRAEEALPRTEFDKHHDDLRGDMKELLGKYELVKDLMHTQIANVEQRLAADLNKMRSDMNGGFNRMQDLIEKRMSK